MPAHELYEAPEPWGLWSLMASKDFGGSAHLRPQESTGMGVTLRGVAMAAGVSRTTASRVLNNSRSVSGPTRAKVLATVAHLSYSPNVHAAVLRRKYVKAASDQTNGSEERALSRNCGQVEQLLALREELLALKRIISSFHRDTSKYLENEESRLG